MEHKTTFKTIKFRSIWIQFFIYFFYCSWQAIPFLTLSLALLLILQFVSFSFWPLTELEGASLYAFLKSPLDWLALVS